MRLPSNWNVQKRTITFCQSMHLIRLLMSHQSTTIFSLGKPHSFIHASLVHPFVQHLHHWLHMIKSHSLCYETGWWSTCGETLELCITFLEQVWTLEYQTSIQLLAFARQPYQLNSLSLCLFVCLYLCLCLWDYVWMKLVKEEDIEEVLIGNIVIIFFVVRCWCGVICKYF